VKAIERQALAQLEARGLLKNGEPKNKAAIKEKKAIIKRDLAGVRQSLEADPKIARLRRRLEAVNQEYDAQIGLPSAPASDPNQGIMEQLRREFPQFSDEELRAALED